MTELFPPETVTKPSPRLVWLEKHRVNTIFTCGMDEPYSAWSGDLREALEEDDVHCGKSQDEALTKLAKASGWRLWNEEGL